MCTRVPIKHHPSSVRFFHLFIWFPRQIAACWSISDVITAEAKLIIYTLHSSHKLPSSLLLIIPAYCCCSTTGGSKTLPFHNYVILLGLSCLISIFTVFGLTSRRQYFFVYKQHQPCIFDKTSKLTHLVVMSPTTFLSTSANGQVLISHMAYIASTFEVCSHIPRTVSIRFPDRTEWYVYC